MSAKKSNSSKAKQSEAIIEEVKAKETIVEEPIIVEPEEVTVKKAETKIDFVSRKLKSINELGDSAKAKAQAQRVLRNN